MHFVNIRVFELFLNENNFTCTIISPGINVWERGDIRIKLPRSEYLTKEEATGLLADAKLPAAEFDWFLSNHQEDFKKL